MVNPIDPFILGGQTVAADKVHGVSHHHPGMQQQHLAQQAKEQAEHKRSSVSANTPPNELVVKDDAGKREGRKNPPHAESLHGQAEEQQGGRDIPEVEEGKIIDIKI